jgi:hypothetical protein
MIGDTMFTPPPSPTSARGRPRFVLTNNDDAMEPINAAEATVERVLSRLLARHPMLRLPSIADRNGFVQKVRLFPEMPEWVWYGILEYAVNEDKRETDFRVLDEMLESYRNGMDRGGGRVWSMLFYYMALRVGSEDAVWSDMPPTQVLAKTEKPDLENKREARTGALFRWGCISFLLGFALILIYHYMAGTRYEVLRFRLQTTITQGLTRRSFDLANTFFGIDEAYNWAGLRDLFWYNVRLRLGDDAATYESPRTEL